MARFRKWEKARAIGTADRDRDRAQLAGERGEPLGARFVNPGAARPLREGPHALHALVERLAFLTPQRLAEQPAEQPHVVAQRLMRIVLVHAAAGSGHERDGGSVGVRADPAVTFMA